MRLKHLSWLPALLLMGIIFGFSSKTADQSAQSSLKITDIVMNVYENISDIKLDSNTRMEQRAILEHYIRKGAHAMEYTLLAVSIAFPLWVRGYRRYRLFLMSVILTAAYAATDEFHQRFVPGRSGELRDILIDASGAVLGAFLFLVVSRVYTRRRKERLKSKAD